MKNTGQQFLQKNKEKFDLNNVNYIIEKINDMENDSLLLMTEFKKPSNMFWISFFLGWDRFFLGQAGLGILKIATLYGLGIWYIIDLFTVKKRTRKYNLKRFNELV